MFQKLDNFFYKGNKYFADIKLILNFNKILIFK